MATAIVNIETYTHDHIYETDPPIFIKFVAKCWSFRPHSSEMKDNLCYCILLKCLAQGHYTVVRGFEPWTSLSGVQSSTTELQRSQDGIRLIYFQLLGKPSFLF